MHKQLKEHKKAKLDREIKEAEMEAYRKARLQRAKQEGRARGLKGKPSTFKSVGGMMDDLSELLVGKDFQVGPSRSTSKAKKKSSTPKFVVVGGKAYPVASKKGKPKPKKRDDDLWDLI